MLETPLESRSGPDQELSVDLTESPEVETEMMSCPADVSSQTQPIPAELDGPEAEPRDELADERVNPYPDLPEIPEGTRSLVPLQCRCTRSR